MAGVDNPGITGLYILDGHTPVVVDDLLVWDRWSENVDNRQVAHTIIGAVDILTLFLGVDYNVTTGGPPALFETCVHGGEFDQEIDRYSTWDEAIAGHEHMVRVVTWRLTVVGDRAQEARCLQPPAPAFVEKV